MFIIEQYSFGFTGAFLGAVIPSYNDWVTVYYREGRRAYMDVLKIQIGL